MQNKMVLLVAESGAGKDTYLNAVKQELANSNCGLSLIEVVSYATRPKRENETNHIEHHFITEEEAKHLLETERITAYTKIEDPSTGMKGYEYFATKSEVDKSNIYIIDPEGVDFFRRQCPEVDTFVVYIYCPLWLRKIRSRKRSDYKEKFIPRCLNEKSQFIEFRKNKKYDLRINNLPLLKELNILKLKKEILQFFNIEEE